MVEMKVIKKSGFRQIYSVEKIKIALQKTAKSINEEFKESDWKEFKPRVLARLEPIMEGREEIFFWEIDDAVIDSLLRSRFKEIAKEYIQSRSRIRKDKLNDLGLTQIAMNLLKERYLKKDDDGNPIESAKELMIRVANAVAYVEKDKTLRELYSTKFINMLCNLEFLPNSPALVSAGTNRKGTWLACFASMVDDSIEDIFEKAKVGAKIFQMGGGFGISLANLREQGAKIKSSGGVSSGPVAFMEEYDVMVKIVKAGGFRKGALMTILNYNHPDIEKFIHCKENIDIYNNMNISVLIKKEFFDCLTSNKDISLVSPIKNKHIKNISPALLLEMIATNIWKTGEPGVLFYDNMNIDNPTPHLGDISVTNPCSESGLLSGEACDLGSINLMKHISDGDVNWDKLAETTKLAVRFLDNMLDGSPYPTEEIKSAVMKTRKIGLGIMGFADLLIELNIKYSSPKSVEMAGKIMSFINDVASKYSEELGKEKGLYPAYKEGYRKRRNSIVTTIAPTGSLSLICGVSSGVEPNLSGEYTRIIDNNVVKITHPMKDKSAFETTFDVLPEQHLAILSEFQKNVENSISKTINCPESTTVADIKNLIIKAHIMGCKGIAIFRKNCDREALIKGCAECQI
ncbi:MAG: adenosylcobalamin-dependent ribonucleoside-diphosphate reductase [Actinobacteria bacterium]|nr:adenosylcobalamin-dependent ribonucleoside-diphosphate reductase [Actinomycetota bacterium]MBE3114749.1 adenosylcobalamin-dependent ribonucleoside-diphosphate reductase [Actinomycetota bacterium]